MTSAASIYLCARYEAGATIEALAEETGLSYRRVRETLLAFGTVLRSPMVRVPQCPPGMVNMYECGASIRAVATRYDLTYSQARNMLRHSGVTLRPPGRQAAGRPNRGC
ncbi:helix-turn-helix domain-containing protein [Amycolatopsis sp. NPDC051758]|uniref:helix-turn-helix domain-containing protein n=1 Tax=Amycolatopsis sp. NPDC051758 TaxID=3363935 RepID=UPI0037A199D7